MIHIRYITILIICVFWSYVTVAQPDTNTLEWTNRYQNEIEQITQLEKLGQNRSAYLKAEVILDGALDRQNIPGIIASLTPLIRNIYRVEDEAHENIIEKLGALQPDHPVINAVLNTYLAELITEYYERNRYRITQLSTEDELSWTTFRRWSAQQIEKTIDSLYKNSIEPDELKLIPSSKAASLMDQEAADIAWNLSPRLYDMLMQRYVDYLRNKRLHWDIILEHPDRETAELMIEQDLSAYLKSDSSDSRQRALFTAFDHWEKSLIAAHETEAYLQVLLQRLQFAHTIIGEKYVPGLITLYTNLIKKYDESPNRLMLDHAKAQLQFQQGHFAAALKTLQTALDQPPAQAYKNNTDIIERLILTIKAPELSVQTEDTWSPGQHPLVGIQFRNLNRVRLEVFPISEKELVEWRFNRTGQTISGKEVSLKKKSIWQQTITLPPVDDYKSHQTEVIIDRNLTKGAYALHYWYHVNELELSGLIVFQVTDLALIGWSDGGENVLQVVHGLTGERIPGSRVEAIVHHRGGTFRKKEIRLLPEFEPGSFLPPEKQANLYYRIVHGNDTFISPLTYLYKSHPNPYQPSIRTVLLTDRAIYKPGQTIHFKALTTLSSKLESEMVKNQNIKLSLRNANGKEVWHQTLTTDEWGTVTGSIPVPLSGLNGRWSLTADPSGFASILVEAYQRPNFEITIPDSTIVRENDWIRLSGRASTYHGFPIQSGAGTIRVELQQRHWFFRAGPETKEEVFTGTFETDEAGDFSIRFEGVDPPRTDRPYGSFYYYSVHGTVQSVSGEIREFTKEFPLDPAQKRISIELPEFQLYDKMDPVLFTVRDALFQPESMEVQIQISQLDAPEQYKVNRYWEIPDLPLLSEREFDKNFKHLTFSHKADMTDWETEKIVKTWTTNISDQDTLKLQDIISQPGYYRLAITAPEGDTLAIQSFGIGDQTTVVHDAVIIHADQTTAEPGQTVKVQFLRPKENKGGMILVAYPDGTTENLDLNKTQSLEIKVAEKDRGGIHIRAFGSLANRFYSTVLSIHVPWSDKMLKITGPESISSLQVNSDTSLTFNVLDNKNKGVLSELGVVIYDASLDAYIPHDWTPEQSFFRSFSNPLEVRSINGTISDLVHSQNNYWQDMPKIDPLYLPVLPRLQVGYGYHPNARRSTMAMDMMSAVPQSNKMAESRPAPELAAEESGLEVEKPAPVRKDFAETVLFVGKEMTDSTGSLTIPFHTNDKAGRWKLLVFAHSSELQTGILSHVFETTQDIILESYLPGMVRQGDQMNLAFTLFNNTDMRISGQVVFGLRPLFGKEKNEPDSSEVKFDLHPGKSMVVKQSISILPNETGPMILTTKVVNSKGRILDATEEVLPVYPATEEIYDGLVYVLKEGEVWAGRDATNLIDNSDNGQVSIRIVQNIHSELLKSIPYLQISNPVTTDQFFRNGVQALLGQYITNNIPGFDLIYEEWKRKGELESRLARQEDQKYVTLENTPWVQQSDSGLEQMALLSLYFDEAYMDQVIETNLTKWAQSQNSDGGFPWIKDGPSSFYITVRFLAQWNKLKWAGISSGSFTDEMQQKARTYIDGEFIRLWKEMKAQSKDSAVYYQRFIPYFTQRAYEFSKDQQSREYLTFWDELKDSVYTHWAEQSDLLRAEIGIAAVHLGDQNISRTIVAGFLDNAIHDTELGTYWQYNHHTMQNGYLGILAKITELLVLHEEKSLNDGIIQWVLVNKMTNDWHQNPNVTALMLSLLKMSGDWTSTSTVEVTHLGQKNILSGIGDANVITIGADELENFRIEYKDGPPIWLGIGTSRIVQPEDEVTQSGDILKIEKIIAGAPAPGVLQLGEPLTVQLRISTDRDLDYVYIQDPLIPGVDPGISLSGFQWSHGLSYYQTFDPSTAQFFIDHLPKGEFILEYQLGAVRTGKFRAPRTKIQSYFVPEINGVDQWSPVVKVN